MSATVLGRSGVVIPSAFLGCGTFGGIGGSSELIGRGLDEDAAFAAMDDAVALGIDVFDTAERYAAGASERTIGDWLRQRPAQLTAKLRLATKVAPPSADGDDDSRFDRPYIEAKLRTSLDRLGVGDVTFYRRVHPTSTRPLREDGSTLSVHVGKARSRSDASSSGSESKGATVAKIKCKYEDAEFDESEFDASGEHLHTTPAHYITGELKPDRWSVALPDAAPSWSRTPPGSPDNRL